MNDGTRQGVWQEAFRIAFGIALATFVWKATHLPHGYWLLLTISVLYIGVNQGHVLQRAGHRILGTALGIVLAYLFVATLMYQNHSWGYMFGFLFVFMFYMYFLTGNYILFVTILTCYIGIYVAVIEGTRVDYFLFGTLFNRFFCTLLGILFVLVLELTVFPNAARSTHQFERTLSSLFCDFADAVRILTVHYVRRTDLSDEDWRLLSRTLEKHASARNLSRLMQYELNLDREYSRFCAAHVDLIGQFIESLRRLVCLARHPRPPLLDDRLLNPIERTGRILQHGFTCMATAQHGGERTPWVPVTGPVRLLFSDEEAGASFVVQELLHIGEVMDELFDRVRTEKREKG